MKIIYINKLKKIVDIQLIYIKTVYNLVFG